MIKICKIWLALALLFGAQAATAQGTTVGLNGAAYDSSQPVEVTSDNLTVDQNSSTAMFEGNARVTQGALRLSADTIRIEYEADGAGVSKVAAEGDVTYSNGTETARADSALYLVGDAEITLSGGVLLLQGENTISGDRLILDLMAGTGSMQGNVKTVFTPGADK